MLVVVVCDWDEENANLASSLAEALGVTLFDVRPRIAGGGPAVVANFADSRNALALSEKLNRSGFSTIIVDTADVRDHFNVRRFELNEGAMRIETMEGHRGVIPYSEIELMLPSMINVGNSQTKAVSEHGTNMGKPPLSGRISVTKNKLNGEESGEKHFKVLYLYAGKRTSLVFNLEGMTYDGLGSDMKLSRELNFIHLLKELRRLCPGAIYDDRLLKRDNQVQLLGPTLKPENNFDLAIEILVRSLRQIGGGDPRLSTSSKVQTNPLKTKSTQRLTPIPQNVILTRNDQLKSETSNSITRFLIPQYNDFSLFLMSFTFIILFLTHADLRSSTDRLLFTHFGIRSFIALVFFILGILFSIKGVFTDREKTNLEKEAMLVFAVIVNVTCGVAAGMHELEGSHGIIMVFPIWNIVNGFLLLLMARCNIINTSSIVDYDATPFQIVLGAAVIAVILSACHFIFDMYWAVTFSICVSYASNVNGLFQEYLSKIYRDA